VLGFTLLLSLVAPVAFGLFPALKASSSGPSAALRDGRSGDGGRSGKRARAFLVTAQVSLALTLMIVASLLTRSMVNLQTRPLGFDAEGLLTVQVTLPEEQYEDPESRLGFYTQAREALSAVPGFGVAELTNVIPGADFGVLRSMTIEGVEQPEGRAAPIVRITTVSAGYFAMIGLPLYDGRAISAADLPESPRVAVVSREIAGRFWPADDAVGRRLRVAGSDDWLRVIGVVGDVRGTNDTDRPSPNMYVPHQQDARGAMYLVSRTTRDPAGLAGPIRAAIGSVDADQAIDAIRTMERAQYLSASSSYALTTLFVTFALFALLMAAIGIYGVMAYSVSQRRSEIGLRMALGAEKGTVRWMILLQGTRLLAIGIGVGLVAAFLLSRLLDNLVFGISTTDPLTFVGVPVVLAVVAMVANLVPAVRATRLDPAKTLRAD